MTTTNALDLLDDVPETIWGLDRVLGKYRFPPPPGVTTKQTTWRRATNLVGAFSDQRALQLWMERLTLLGLLSNDGVLFDELAVSGVETMEPAKQRDWLEQFAKKCRAVVGGDSGARKGTARHDMLDHYISTGETRGHRRMLLQMESLLEALERHQLDVIPGTNETHLWHPAAGGTVGRRDCLVSCRLTGQIGLLDLKTQEKFWTYQEHSGQQAVYHDAPWRWDDAAQAWVPNETFMGQRCDDASAGNHLRGRPGGVNPGGPVALLAHMPSKGEALPVEIHELSIPYGRKVVEEAVRITELRSVGKSVKAGRRVGGIRPL
jgi:hypothetical protein